MPIRSYSSETATVLGLDIAPSAVVRAAAPVLATVRRGETAVWRGGFNALTGTVIDLLPGGYTGPLTLTLEADHDPDYAVEWAYVCPGD